MKKNLLLMMVLGFICLVSNAQTKEFFHVTPDGTFATDEGNDFVIVQYEGKNAHQIYQELAANVGSVYNNPSKVMSSVEDVSIKIRALDDFLTNSTMGIPVGTWQGYYQLEFRIKDGRVRVEAPQIEPYFHDSNYMKPRKSYLKYVKGIFKNGEVKQSKKKEYIRLNSMMNNVINVILGTMKSKEEQDW